MINLKLIVFLAIGTAVMWVPIMIISRWYCVKIWKSIPVAIFLTIIGTIGTYLMFFVENQEFGGRSFYGALFFVPVPFFLIAKLIHISYGEILDLCAPAECVMLAIMKVQCVVDGCCGGIELYKNIHGDIVHFPSQIVELVCAILAFFALVLIAYREKNRGVLYPWYMIIYGFSRFILNFFRANTQAFFLGLPAGSFWSVCAVLIGGAVLIVNRRNTHRRRESGV